MTLVLVPDRPLRGCLTPGCPGLVRGRARCDEHTRALQREIDSMRPSAARRGYGHRWRELRRKVHLPRNPVCVECVRLGVPLDPKAVLEVDHIDGDVTNCAASNLRTFCKRHHSQRTARDQAFGRRQRQAR